MLSQLFIPLLLLMPPLPESEGPTRVNRVLVDLKAAKAGPDLEVFEIGESDLNEYLKVVLAGKGQLGVKSLVLDFQKAGGIEADAVVDMDKVERSGFAFSLAKTFFSGTQRFRGRGNLSMRGSKAVLTVDQAKVNDRAVPLFLVRSMLSFLSKRQPPHIDVTEPFELPYGLRTILVQEDRIRLVR